MNITTKDFLDMHTACEKGHNFAKKYQTMAEVWDDCPRADWLIWILRRLKVANNKGLDFGRFACWCVRETPLGNGKKAWQLLTDERSKNAVVIAEKYCFRDATVNDLRSADDAADFYAYAVIAAASDTASASYYAAAAADITADAASDTAAAQKFQADEFRRRFPNPFLVSK